ncbi:MAG: alkaline phosphatase family protein, partial [Vicinamibacterales bacterium]
LAFSLSSPELPFVLMISIDGLRADRLWASDVELPTLRRLAREGVHARGVVGVVPSITYPSHTTLITGVTPDVHGIYGNRLFDPEGRAAGSYWDARDIRVPTLPLAVRSRGVSVGSVSWPVSVGLDVDVLFPEYFGLPQAKLLRTWREQSRPSSLLDDVESSRGRTFRFPFTDADRVAIAARVIQHDRPRFMLVHLFDADSAQHRYGPDSDEATRALVLEDDHLQALLTAVNDAGLRDRMNVVVVSDHGFVNAPRQMQLNAVFKEAGWLTVDDRGRITSWRVFAQPAGGMAFVMLQDPTDTRLLRDVEVRLRDLARDPANGIERVLTREDLTRLGTDPRASFGVFMAPGTYATRGTRSVLATSTARGGHGYDPELPAMHATFVARGPNVPRRGDIGIIRMTQIAPTIASWYGTALSPRADVPIDLPTK